MTDQRSPEQLAEWIRANRGAFTREALERAMAEQGWSPAEIAAAWHLVEGQQPSSRWVQSASHPPGPSNVRSQQILLFVLLAPITAIALLFEASFGPYSTASGWTPILVAGMALTAAVPIVALAAVSRSVLPVGCAGLVALVLVVGVAIFGSCLLTLQLAGIA